MTKDEALKLALDALETSMYPQQKQLQAITAIKEALAQPEQTTGNILMDSYKAMQSMKVEGPRHVVCQCDKCKAQPEACKECHLKDLVYDLLGELKVANLKLSVRAERTLIALTDEEREQVINANTSTGLWHMAKDIEAKLKEKNSG